MDERFQFFPRDIISSLMPHMSARIDQHLGSRPTAKPFGCTRPVIYGRSSWNLFRNYREHRCAIADHWSVFVLPRQRHWLLSSMLHCSNPMTCAGVVAVEIRASQCNFPVHHIYKTKINVLLTLHRQYSTNVLPILHDFFHDIIFPNMCHYSCISPANWERKMISIDTQPLYM